MLENALTYTTRSSSSLAFTHIPIAALCSPHVAPYYTTPTIQSSSSSSPQERIASYGAAKHCFISFFWLPGASSRTVNHLAMDVSVVTSGLPLAFALWWRVVPWSLREGRTLWGVICRGGRGLAASRCTTSQRDQTRQRAQSAEPPNGLLIRNCLAHLHR